MIIQIKGADFSNCGLGKVAFVVSQNTIDFLEQNYPAFASNKDVREITQSLFDSLGYGMENSIWSKLLFLRMPVLSSTVDKAFFDIINKNEFYPVSKDYWRGSAEQPFSVLLDNYGIRKNSNGVRGLYAKQYLTNTYTKIIAPQSFSLKDYANDSVSAVAIVNMPKGAIKDTESQRKGTFCNGWFLDGLRDLYSLIYAGTDNGHVTIVAVTSKNENGHEFILSHFSSLNKGGNIMAYNGFTENAGNTASSIISLSPRELGIGFATLGSTTNDISNEIIIGCDFILHGATYEDTKRIANIFNDYVKNISDVIS